MTGQADVRWIWMAVALVVVAVPLLTVLFNREIRVLQQRVGELERHNGDLRARIAADLQARTAHAVAGLAAQQREQLLDVLRTLSAMRPAEPEFTEEYYVEGPRRD